MYSSMLRFTFPASFAPGGAYQEAPALALAAVSMSGASRSLGLCLLCSEGLRAHSEGAPLPRAVELAPVSVLPRTSARVPVELYEAVARVAHLEGVALARAWGALLELGASRLCGGEVAL